MEKHDLTKMIGGWFIGDFNPTLHKTKDFTLPYSWNINKQWSLMPGNLELTNVRLFSKPIELEQHTNILQQYVVRDNHLAKIIDNAIPSIQLRRYNQNR